MSKTTNNQNKPYQFRTRRGQVLIEQIAEIEALAEERLQAGTAYHSVHVGALALLKLALEEMVILLLRHGADPKRLDKDGSGPLFSAVIQKDTRILKLLLDHGADPNKEHDLGEPLYNWAEFDYRYDEYGIQLLPEEPTEEDKSTEDEWLQFLDRLAIKHGKRRPDYLFLLRAAGAKTWRELDAEQEATKQSDQKESS